MYLWIICVALLVIAIIGILIAKFSFLYDELGVLIAIISIIAFLMMLAICIFGSINTPQEISLYVTQKQYIETHLPKNSVEDAALTTKKIELNEWLYKAKYSNQYWHGWNFYPDSIQGVSPIV